MRYMPFIIDEGSKNLHKYQWNNKLQFMLVQMSDTERYQNKACYVCFPNFKELNSAFRNDRIMMRIYLYERNKEKGFSSAIMSLKDVNRFVTDPWHTDENARQFEWLLRKTPAAFRTPKDILYAESKLQGFAGEFKVPSLEKIAPRIWNIYMAYKIYHAQKNPVDSDDEEENISIKVQKWKMLTRKLIDFAMELKPDLQHKVLAQVMGIPKASLSKLLTETDKKETTNIISQA